MKFLLYALLVLLLVPLQTTLLPHVSVWNVKPDLGLVAVGLVGLLAAELDGLFVGLAIGWVFNMFSAGELWVSLLTYGGLGLVAGFLGRQVSHVTAVSLGIGLLLASVASGLLAALSAKASDMSQMWWMVESIVLPQACYDAVVGAGLFALISQRFNVTRLRSEAAGL